MLKKIISLSLTALVLFSFASVSANELYLTPTVDLKSESKLLSVDELHKLPSSSEERYVFLRALENNITFEEAQNIVDREESIIPLAPVEYISYRTFYTTANTSIRTTNFGYIPIKVASEIRCVVNRLTGKVVYVEEFGSPYAYTNDYFVNFDHGGFTTQRLSDTKARVSATGRFIMEESVGIGFDIVSYGVSGTVKSSVFSIYAYIGY